MRPVSGTVKSDGQSLTYDSIKGKIGGGDATATIDARPGADGHRRECAHSAQWRRWSGVALSGLAMPPGRVSLQATLMTQGRSASALTSALSGNGTVTLESAGIAGLDSRAFDAATRASDGGEATDDTHLRQIVDPILSSGVLPLRSAQIPFTIRDGRLRVEATTLDTQGARTIISGGYDIPADQADIRASIAPNSAGFGTGHPEIQLFAAGTPDKLDRSIDVSALSSWLAVRTIDRETRRLDAIERGERPPVLPASTPRPRSLCLRLRTHRIRRQQTCRCLLVRRAAFPRGLGSACRKPHRRWSVSSCAVAATDRGAAPARRGAAGKAAAARSNWCPRRRPVRSEGCFAVAASMPGRALSPLIGGWLAQEIVQSRDVHDPQWFLARLDRAVARFRLESQAGLRDMG